MTAAGSAHYHPISLNREYLAGKMLEEYARKHAKAWNLFSMEQPGPYPGGVPGCHPGP